MMMNTNETYHKRSLLSFESFHANSNINTAVWEERTLYSKQNNNSTTHTHTHTRMHINTHKLITPILRKVDAKTGRLN